MTEPIVIVGAALTGGSAAVTLRQEGYDGPLVLVGSEAHLPYERPPLSKAFLRGETAFEDSLVRPGEFWREHDVDLRLGVVAEAIDPDRRRVRLADGEEVPYRLLLLATGARNRRFPIPGLDLPGVCALRTVEESERIRVEIAPGRRATVIGMGFIGSEVAASLRSKGVEVTAIDGGSVPLERVLGSAVGAVLEGIHRDHGVELVFKDRLAAFEGSSGQVDRVVTAGGRTIECDFAVVGMGVEPVTEIVAGTAVEVEGGIVVDEFCRTNLEGVFAAGDVANHWHPVFARRMRNEHWQNARTQGRAAALSMLGKGAPYDEIPWFWSDQYEHNIQYAGYHTEWDELVVRGSLEERAFTAFYIKAGRVQAAVGVDRGPEVRQCLSIIRGRRIVDPDALRDEGADLATLA